MHIEEFFVETMADLETRVTTEWVSEYQLIRSAGLLRHLLIDGLLIDANRRLRLPIEFTVPDRAPSPANLAGVGDADVRVQPSLLKFVTGLEPAKTIGLDDFLGLKVVATPAGMSTVADVVRMIANTMGGMHHGKPRERTREIRRVADAWRVNGIPLPLHLVVDVAVRAIFAAEPLRAALADDQATRMA